MSISDQVPLKHVISILCSFNDARKAESSSAVSGSSPGSETFVSGRGGFWLKRNVADAGEASCEKSGKDVIQKDQPLILNQYISQPTPC